MIETGQTLGAVYLGDQRTRFRVWAPGAEQMEVRLLTPEARTVEMEHDRRGYWEATVDGVDAGCLYVFRLNGEKERPDPASRYQPDGVHGPSQVVDLDDFVWTDRDWHGLPLAEYIIYELHTGTFTPEGMLDAIIPHLPGLKELGITAIEIMPVAQFPGTRNWGYDGVDLFAVQNSYGGPLALKKVVDAAHGQGLAVVLDVVYNHLGAEGNYLWDYGPYFTERYKTPWGSAFNYDGPGSDGVRHFFMQNARYWLDDFHVDALRLDAVHAILDFSAGTFLEQLAAAVEQQRECTGRHAYLIGESDLNDSRVVRTRAEGGFGLQAQWSDDFHHSVHALLTGEGDGYYQDFVRPNGHTTLGYLAKTLRKGYAYTGQYSRYRRRRHGNSPDAIPGERFVVCIQNHDQIGNRMMGDRLSTIVPFDQLKLAAGILLLSPFVPLLFMGEEYGETDPFQYFVSHTDGDLVEAVRQGRREEFADFIWSGEPPDPADEETFLRSKLCRQDAQAGGHQVLYELYRDLIRIRKALPALRQLSKDHMDVQTLERQRVLYMHRWAARSERQQNGGQIVAAFNFGNEPAEVCLDVPSGKWRKHLDSAAARWQTDDDGQLLSEPLTVAAARAAAARARTAHPVTASTAPEWLDTNGTASIRLSPASFVLYATEESG